MLITGVIENLSRMLSQDLYYYLSDLPRWHIFAIFLFGYIVYYFIEVVKVNAYKVILILGINYFICKKQKPSSKIRTKNFSIFSLQIFEDRVRVSYL